jgi:hypothetical protein
MSPTFKMYASTVKIDWSLLEGPFPDLTEIDWPGLEKEAVARLDAYMAAWFSGQGPQLFDWGALSEHNKQTTRYTQIQRSGGRGRN